MASRLPDDLVRFIQTRLGSMWALELMLRMSGDPARDWSEAELVRELRATDLLVSGLLNRFQRSGLAARTEKGAWRWQPASAELGDLSRRTAAAHAATPFAVIQAVADSPGLSILEFADAFRLRKDKGEQ